VNTIANSAGAISPSFTPFSLVDNRVLKSARDIGALAVAVYSVLASYADNRTRMCWPGEEAIAETLGLARETVSRCICRLEEFNLVSIQRRPGRSSVYRLVDADWRQKKPRQPKQPALAAPPQGCDPESQVGCDPGSHELDPLLNYTQKQQQAPVLEQAALPEPAEAVVVFSSIQEIAETVIPEPAQERKERLLDASETETLADSLPLPKKAAVKLLERAPEAERPAIVETFNAARLKRTILNPAAYLAALVQACILGTFTPEAAQQAQRDQEKRRRNAEALARSNVEMERRAMERLGLASPNADTGEPVAGPGAADRAKAAAKWAALRASLRGGVPASPGG